MFTFRNFSGRNLQKVDAVLHDLKTFTTFGVFPQSSHKMHCFWVLFVVSGNEYQDFKVICTPVPCRLCPENTNPILTKIVTVY